MEVKFIKNRKMVAGLLAILMMVTMLSMSAFAKNAPAPQYQGLFPEWVEYNSEGVPLLGQDVPMLRHSPDGGTYKINGVSIPLPGYQPDVDKWGGSETCVGFAKYVYNTIWSKTGTSFDKKIEGKEQAKTVIKALKAGTRITGFKDNAQVHTMVIMKTNTNDFVVYHANYSKVSNLVKMTKFTYEEFAALFNSVQGYNPPA